MAETKKRLFAGFPEVTTQQWEEKIIADLKGKDYEKALVWHTNEGFPVKPYYRAENLEGLDFLDSTPGEFPFTRGNKNTNNWLIRQDIFVNNLAEANKKAMEILGKGINSLGFIFNCNTRLGVEELKALLKDICLEAAEVNFVCSCKKCDVTQAFSELVNSGPWDNKKVVASTSNDPLVTLMLKGKFDEGSENSAFSRLKMQVDAGSQLLKFRTIGVNGKYFGNCGASVVQELAFSLAMGSEYLSRLTEMGLSVDEVAHRIKFNLSIGNNYFMEIAKLRAGRLLWAQIVKAFGPEKECSRRMMVHAETGNFNKTIYDPYVNLLRTQTEAMAAALGGAHSIAVLPFDTMYGNPSDFSERIARNQQILLKEEANIDKIADAPGGSYYIENLTASIAEQAWKLFLEADDRGGFSAALREGFVQKNISETAARHDRKIALRHENLLGLNQFPDFSEIISDKLDESVFKPLDLTAEDAEVETLKPYRSGRHFEALRYRTDVYSQKHKRPAAFMLSIGDPAMRRARALFSSNFFAVAGFEVIDNNGFSSVDEGLTAACASGAEIVVACSSDDEYAAIVPELAGKIGNKILVVAGNPVCRPELEKIGVKYFVHVKSNLLEELTKYQKLLNI